jgi:hypothetical protein
MMGSECNCGFVTVRWFYFFLYCIKYTAIKKKNITLSRWKLLASPFLRGFKIDYQS